MPPRSAVFDNWSLQLACELLEFSIIKDETFKIRRPSGYDTMVFDQYKEVGTSPVTWSWFTSDHITSLLRLLDAIVLYDSFSHDEVRSFVWKESPVFDEISQILKPVSIPKKVLHGFDKFVEENKRFNIDDANKYNDFKFEISGEDGLIRDLISGDPFFETPDNIGVVEDAIFYLTYADSIGATYWPAPKRGNYLSNTIFSQTAFTFSEDIRSMFQKNIRKATEEIAGKLYGDTYRLFEMPTLNLPGFGSSVLGQCETAEDILPAVMKLRYSEGAFALREWLRKYENLISDGDVLAAADLIKGVGALVLDLERSLDCKGSYSTETQIQIGMTPSVNINSGVVSRFFRELYPKPPHMLFIKDHIKKSLKTADLSISVNRLFPGLPINSGVR